MDELIDAAGVLECMAGGGQGYFAQEDISRLYRAASALRDAQAREKVLVEALKGLLRHVSASDDVHITHSVWISESDRLRKMADDIDDKDRCVRAARAAIPSQPKAST